MDDPTPRHIDVESVVADMRPPTDDDVPMTLDWEPLDNARCLAGRSVVPPDCNRRRHSCRRCRLPPHPEPPRIQPLRLPGVSIVLLVGPTALPGDIELPNGLWMSGPARVLDENAALRGHPPKSKAGTETVDDRIDDLARSGGAGRVRTTLEQLDVIAGSFDPNDVEHLRERLTALLGSFADEPRAASGRLSARLAGTPYDAHRIEMEALFNVLLDRPPVPALLHRR